MNTINEYVTLVGLVPGIGGAAVAKFSWEFGVSNSKKNSVGVLSWAMLATFVGIILMFVGGILNPDM